MIAQYSICHPVQDLSDKKSGSLIGHGSRVVVLSIEGTKAKVCRFGHYLDSVLTDIKFLSPQK